MYLPRNVPLCRPHVAMWIGESGKRYDFAVCRPGIVRMDEPAVYILARHEGDVTTPLLVGYTGSLHRHFGLSSERCPEEWRRALARGMTHVHLRFDASSTMARRAEVRDLVAALRPALNDQSVQDEEPALEGAERAAVPTGQARVYRPERCGVGSKARSPALAAVDAGRYLAGSRGLAPPPLFRADPAREDNGYPGDFETSVAHVATPPDVQHQPHSEPAAATFEENAAAVHIAPLAASQGQWDMQLAAVASPEGVEVAQVTRSAEPAGLASFLRRVREFVARLRAPRQPDSFKDAGSAEPRSVAPAGVAEPAAPPAAGPAEPNAGTGGTREAAWEEAVPVQHEHSADAKPAEASEDAAAPEPEPVAAEAASVGQQEAKRSLDLEPSAPVVLFAGNLSYEAGADILLDAIVTVCCNGDHEALFLFAGEGAMRGELQGQASRAGLERRCRFLGHVPASDFDRVLSACDFVVIPGRVPQGEDLARIAVANGKPVLTTHQAGTGGVIVHGQNGLITYDNPGSLVWGIRELLGPIYANLRRKVAETA